jgi:hypothetical protein
MWFSNSWNNFAPFAGSMLRGYEHQRTRKNAPVKEATTRSQKETPPKRCSISLH